MKKKILTQIMVLSFAFGGLFVVGNNSLAFETNHAFDEIADDDVVVVNCPGGPKECARITTGQGKVHLFYEPN